MGAVNNITPPFHAPLMNQNRRVIRLPFIPPPLSNCHNHHRRRHGRCIINPHWRPYWAMCAPCTVPYDLVLKVETLARDQEYAIRLLGLEGTAFNLHTHASKYVRSPMAIEIRTFFQPTVSLQVLSVISTCHIFSFICPTKNTSQF